MQLRDLLESVLYHPWHHFLEQNDENHRLLEIKKISNEAIEGKATEATAMLVDNEVPADHQQLNDLITKAVQKATQPLQKQLEQQTRRMNSLQLNDSNFEKRGRSPGASPKKKSGTPKAPKNNSKHINRKTQRSPS